MKKQSGFTAIEMMVSVAILAILVGIGIPSLRLLIQSMQISAVTNDVVSTLQVARSEAVKRGVPVTVCSSNNQATCSGGWIDGWVVRDNAAAANPPFRVWPATRAGVGIVVGGAVEFNALGGVTNAQCFQITLDTLTRFVGVGPSGRVASSNVACP
ncbi:GspH/FimT family pseudopilin [Hydrogenophaga sp. 5NK40-0174]|uniref:GspH/FimT family pseudopilin n=1 Tax=Hydrogenophaga sp. 5NK40-0174 TaxID=3127649 RepID=UPI003342A67B